VQKYWERHPVGTKARLAMDLLLFSGVRRSDVVTLGRRNEDGDTLRFTEAKNRLRAPKHRVLPILPILRVSLDACPSGHTIYLVTTFHKPCTANGVGNWFRRRCNEAGLTGCSAHGLRKAGATIAAGNGATAHQLKAIFGWKTLKEAARYTEKADNERLASEAM